MKRGFYFGSLLLAGVVGAVGGWLAHEFDDYIISCRLEKNYQELQYQEVNVYSNEANRKLLGEIKFSRIGWNKKTKIIAKGDEGIEYEADYIFEYNPKKLEGILKQVIPEGPKELVAN